MSVRSLPSAGHAGGHLRDAFAALVENGTVPEDADHRGRALTPLRVTGLLWNCTDVMPRSLCEELDVPQGSTYAQGARRYRHSA